MMKMQSRTMMHNIDTKQEIQSSVSKVECYVCGKGLSEGHSISAKTFISELKNNEINNYEISPDDFGIKNFNINDLSVENIDESLTMMKSVFDNSNNAAKAIVSLNAGTAIYASGISDSIKAGVEIAINMIESGAAKKKFEMLIQHTQSFNA